MIEKRIGTGLAPDVAIVDDLVYVAWGTLPDAVVVAVFTLDGVEVARTPIADGFQDAWPRFGGRWLAYKRGGDFGPSALDVVSGQSFKFQGLAQGNFGLAVNDALGVVAYQWGPENNIWFGSLVDGTAHSSPLTGAPDGLDQVVSLEQVTLRKDTRLSVPDMFWPVHAGDVVAGEYVKPPYGIAVQLAGDGVRVALQGQDCPVPRVASSPTHVALVTGGPAGVRLVIRTRDEIRQLPLGSSFANIPAFTFTHPVSVYPFKADGSGAPDLFSLGPYTEAPVMVVNPPADQRLVIAHDGLSDWALPAGLRLWDLPLLELYRTPAETLLQSAARWVRQVQALLHMWNGDVGVIPMFYCQGGVAGGTPPEFWAVADVLEGLTWLSQVVNLSPRIKVIAPFAYNRANGITAHPELRQAFAALLAAAADAGPATLLPISSPPAPAPHAPAPHPKPQPAPTPAPVPSTPFPAADPLGGSMRVFLKLGAKYVGCDPTPAHGKSGDAAFPAYHDRASGGAWEEVEATAHDGDQFDARLVASNRQLSIDQFGILQTRAAGAIGGDELFYMTTQPDGSNLLYRFQDGKGLVPCVLTIEEKP